MTNTKPATPLPWKENWNDPLASWIEGPEQQVVASEFQHDGLDDDDVEQNAAYIVHAANAYPELVRAAQRALAALRALGHENVQGAKDAAEVLAKLGEES